IKEKEPIITGLGNPAIPGSTLTTIGLAYHMNTGISLHKFARDFGRLVARAVVHHNRFPMRRGLYQEGFQGICNGVCRIISGYDDRYMHDNSLPTSTGLGRVCEGT